MKGINSQSLLLGSERSAIREIFEYGNCRAKEVGRENVFDFSLGNPAVPTPACINNTISDMLSDGTFTVHGYTSAQGAQFVRDSIAQSISGRFDFNMPGNNLYMTCGAAASLTITLNAICNKGDRVIAIAPYFPEYKVFAESAGAEFKVVDADRTSFQINFDSLSEKLSANTRAVIINSPNNPSGAVLTEAVIVRLCKILNEHSAKYGEPIYIISDEPYRELVYGDVSVPYIPKYYRNTIVCYSYSKSLSLAGDRIGYIAVSPLVENCKEVYAAICGSGRKLGYVCAPALLQYAVGKNPNACADIAQYKSRRDMLYNALTEYGYECVHPDGAFYLFVKLPYTDFIERAKEQNLLVVPSDSFGVSGYMRISYCVSSDTIERSLPVFKQLI